MSSDWRVGMKIVNHRWPTDIRIIKARKDDDSGWWLADGSGLKDGISGWESVWDLTPDDLIAMGLGPSDD